MSPSAGVTSLRAVNQHFLSAQQQLHWVRNKVHDKCNVLDHCYKQSGPRWLFVLRTLGKGQASVSCL